MKNKGLNKEQEKLYQGLRELLEFDGREALGKVGIFLYLHARREGLPLDELMLGLARPTEMAMGAIREERSRRIKRGLARKKRGSKRSGE
jgi:hypothetical protein